MFFWDKSYKHESDLEVSRRILLLNYLFIAIIGFLLPFGILAIIQNDLLLGFLDLSLAVLVLSSRLYYVKSLNYKFLSYTIIILLGSFYLYLLASGGNSFSGPLWSFTFPVTVLFMLGRKKGLNLILIYFFLSALIFIFEPFPDVFSFSYKIRFLGAYLATAVITYYVEYIRESTQKVLLQKNIELKNSFDQLDIKERELADRELHYRTLFEKSNDAIFLMDGPVFIDCNPKTLAIFGCSRDDIINKTPDNFSPERQPNGKLSKELAMQKINLALEGKHQYFEWVHKRLDGTNFFADVSLDKIEIANKNIVLASVRDISDRKLVEESLLIAKEKAEKSDRLKSDFLAQMSHEIRTPINTIMNYTSLLKMEFENSVGDDNKGSFVSIENAAIRLLRTIDLILNISDFEAGTYEPKFEEIQLLDMVVIPIVNEFKQAAENKNLSLELVNYCTTEPIAKLDNYTIHQSVANLIDNAIKYTQRGKVSVVLSENKNNYIISIKDTGLGISKDYLPKLFDKFSQEDAGYTRKFEGSGLGLTLVKKYCEVNNINLSVESEKGLGTTFNLEFQKSSL